jgi:hypothetical protein
MAREDGQTWTKVFRPPISRDEMGEIHGGGSARNIVYVDPGRQGYGDEHARHPDGQQPAARRNHKERQNLIRVLEATLNLPMHGSQRPARRRHPATIGFRVGGQPLPIFSPERASPQGYQELDGE